MRCLAHWFWFATIHVSAEGLLRILLPPHAIAAAAAGVTSASPQVIIETRGQDSLVQQETLWVGPGLAISRAAPNAFVSGCSQLLSLSDSSSPIAPRYETIPKPDSTRRINSMFTRPSCSGGTRQGGVLNSRPPGGSRALTLYVHATPLSIHTARPRPDFPCSLIIQGQHPLPNSTRDFR